MSSYVPAKVLADTLDDLADLLTRAAETIRDLDELELDDPDERRRATARERMRRLRARRSSDHSDDAASDSYANTRNEPRNRSRNSDAESAENFGVDRGPSLGTDPREVGPSDDGTPHEPRNSDANSYANTRNGDAPTDEELKALGRQKVRELGDALRAARGAPPS